MIKSIRILLAIVGGIIGYQFANGPANIFVNWVAPHTRLAESKILIYLSIVLGIMLMYWLPMQVAQYASKFIRRSPFNPALMPASDLMSGTLGLIMGLLISVLLFPSLPKLGGVGWLLPFLVSISLGVAGFRLGYVKRQELSSLLFHRSAERGEDDARLREEHKILDTSVIIDGRVADICKTGFIEGILVIPGFVLEELQHIADSSDLLKRNRGRRGLDILNKIQKELDIQVMIYEGDFEEISEVDSKLVKLAKVLQGKVVTNDYNLNKVCELQGVSVLNINDLANAVKPVVLPGEEIVVQVIKDGKEHGQGVAYLDDGTMIVVEGGRDFIGNTLDVMVTSVLQTSAGRMIFAKPKLLEKAL